MKRVDALRYMLMHTFGGVYIDADVECVQPFDEFVRLIPRGAGATGGYPEPMTLASWPRNEFWLFMVQHAVETNNSTDTWHGTGPAGLHNALVRWGDAHGRQAFLPFGEARSWYKPLTEFEDRGPVPPGRTFTFFPNERVDPAACDAGQLADCRDTFCATKWPFAYLVHHCLNSWRSTPLGDSR